MSLRVFSNAIPSMSSVSGSDGDGDGADEDIAPARTFVLVPVWGPLLSCVYATATLLENM